MKHKCVLVTLAIAVLFIMLVSGTALAAGSHVSGGTVFTSPGGGTTGILVINAKQINPNGGAKGHLAMKAESFRLDGSLLKTSLFYGKVLFVAINGNQAWLGGEFTRAQEVYYYDEWGYPLEVPLVNNYPGWQFILRVQDNGAVGDLASYLWFDDDPLFAVSALGMPEMPCSLVYFPGYKVRVW